MAKTYQRIWSPNRDARSIKAWASVLSLREETWIWKRDVSRHKASWWVLDGASPIPDDVLQEQQKSPGVRCILLASESPHLPNSSWRWVATPLQINRVNQWLDIEVARHVATQQPLPEWRDMALHLVRRPDISAYGANMALVVACSRMQQAWLTYDALLQLGLSESVVNRFLTDTYRSGSLELQKMRSRSSRRSAADGDSEVLDSRQQTHSSRPGFLSSLSSATLRWKNSKSADETAKG